MGLFLLAHPVVGPVVRVYTTAAVAYFSTLLNYY